jgi:galactofuranose transport system substrate-binding protein
MERMSFGRKAVVSLTVGALMLAWAGCGSDDSSSSDSASKGDPKCRNGDKTLEGKTIGLSFAQSQALFSQLQDDIKEFAKRSGCGLKFKVTNANGDPSKQLTDSQQLVAQGVDLLWTNPAEPPGWSVVQQKAKAAGIPYMNWSSIPVADATTNATVAQAQAGALVAQPAADWIKAKQGGKADVALLVSLTDPGFQARADAFKKKLLELAPGAKIIATAPGGFTDPSVAEKATLNLIRAHPSLKMVFADWDGASLGAAQAAREAGKTDPDQFYIAGQDGSPEQLALMSKPGAVLQSSGTLLFRYDAGIVERDMERLLLGKPVPPTRLLIPELVTTANVKKIEKLQSDPFNPANASVFKRITAYYDTPIKPGDPLPGADVQPVQEG